jgi:hypothetical protein
VGGGGVENTRESRVYYKLEGQTLVAWWPNPAKTLKGAGKKVARKNFWPYLTKCGRKGPKENVLQKFLILRIPAMTNIQSQKQN